MRKILPNGFTLIELLVAVTIIAILASIGLLAYGSFIKSARDAKRQADLRSIQSALEQYFADQVFYPYSSGGASALNLSSTSSITNCTGNPSTSCTVTKTYMSTIPKDPVSSNLPYCYHAYTKATPSSACDNSSQKCTDYVIMAKVDNNSLATGSYGDCVGSYNYQVSGP